MLFKGNYQGSSFAELLQIDHPQLLPRFSAPGEGRIEVPHGTTVLAFKFADGVLVAGDRLATEGHRVASRDVQKVFETDQHSLVAISGAAGPCIEMARLLCLKAAHYMDQGDARAAAPWIHQIKVVAPRVALKVIDEAVQMFGGQGISQDTPLAQAWTHVRTLRLADGPDAVHRRQVARTELRKYTQEKV